jgi:hypothetical protein
VSSALAANLETLRRRLPALAGLVATASPAALEPRPAASGEMSASAPGGALLHSTRDPRLEARRLAAACLGSGEDAALLLGFGLGYGAEACLASGASSVLACEADAGALAAALGLRDMGPLLADERLGFIVGGEPEAVIAALELTGSSRAGLLENRAATAADPEWFGRARVAAERWNAKGRINENTQRRFGRLWVRNLARNLGAASSSLGVDALEGLFAGKARASPLPALVLAAGPSLDEVLPRAAELSRRAVLVCVDTALRSLLRAGVEPDFLVVVDPQYWNWRHIAGLSSPSSILVSESAAWPAVFRSPRSATFLGGSLFPLGRRLEAFAGEKGRLGAGGSVATSAWDLARLAGASPVWMAGLDLAFPGGRTHAAASLFEQRALAQGRRLEPAATAQAAALVGGRSFEAPSRDGGSVRTDERMSLYAWWFESRFARPGSPPTIAIGRGGLAIPGLACGSLDMLLALPDRRGEIDEALARARAARPGEGAPGAAARGLGSLRAELESIERIASGAARAAALGREAYAAGRDCSPQLAALEAADASILSVEGRDVAGFLLPPLAELAGRRARDLGDSLAQSEALYSNVAQSARYHLEVLSKTEY